MRRLFVLALLIGCEGDRLDPAGDMDGDGFSQDQGDCDDTDDSVFPGATESCDGVDTDCDGADGGPGITEPVWFEDVDADGVGDDATAVAACEAPQAGWVDVAGDCAPTDAATYPGAAEVCDGVDNTCEGDVDEGLPTVFADADGDGFGDPSAPLDGCDVGDGRVLDDTDCDDDDSTVNPDTVWYYDSDQDGWGLDTLTDSGCESPGPDYASQQGDCRPDDPLGYPGADEICDNGNQPQNIDDNCNGFVDEGCRSVFECDPIDEDTTWTGTVIVSCNVDVGGPDAPTLTIADGATIRFGQSNRLRVGSNDPGVLHIEDGPLGVRFTADADEPEAGHWRGVDLGTAAGSSLSNLTIAYAGAQEAPALTVRGDGVAVSGLSIVDAADDGLALVGGDTEITDLHASGVSGDAIVCEVGADGAIDGAQVSHSGGVMRTHLDCADALSGEVELTNNERNYVDVSGLTLRETTTWAPLGVPYRLSQGMNIAGSESRATLTLEPGVTVTVESGQSVSVGAAGQGALVATGSEAAPIVFTSASTTPAPGDWVGLVFQDADSTSELTHVDVSYAGSSNVFDASVYIEGTESSVVARDLSVREGAADAIQVWGGRLDLADCSLTDHAGAGLAVEPFGDLIGAVTGCTVSNNGVSARFGNADAIDRLSAASTFSGNDQDSIVVTDMTLERDSVWVDLGVPYLISRGLTVASSDGAELSVTDATVRFAPGTQLQVGMTSSRTGSLIATGSTFEGAVSGPGAWIGVGVRGPLDFVGNTVRDAGASNSAAIELYGGPVSMSDTAIEDAAGIGIRCWPGASITDLGHVLFTNVPTTYSGCL